MIEDLFVYEEYRGHNFGVRLLRLALMDARKEECYKVICTSRFEREHIHDMYTNHGFKEQGLEFRLDLK